MLKMFLLRLYKICCKVDLNYLLSTSKSNQEYD